MESCRKPEVNQRKCYTIGSGVLFFMRFCLFHASFFLLSKNSLTLAHISQGSRIRIEQASYCLLFVFAFSLIVLFPFLCATAHFKREPKDRQSFLKGVTSMCEVCNSSVVQFW